MPEEDIQEFLVEFGKKVRQLREERKMTQMDLVGITNLDRRHIQRIEGGKVNTTLRNVYLLAKALGVSPVNLLMEGENE